jgi:hypothetical protein
MYRPLLLTALVLALTGLSASAQPPAEVKSLTAQLERQMKEFATAKARAQKTALEKFDTAIRKLESNGSLSADVRATMRRQLVADREKFKSSGAWPDEGLPLLVQYEYSRAIHKAYQPPARTLDSIIRLYDQAKNDKAVAEWQETKAKLDQQIPGRSDLTAGSRWDGSVSASDGRSALVRLTIEKMTGNLINCELHTNLGVPGHPIFSLGGRVEGNSVSFSVTAVKQGRAQLREFTGFLLGDERMVVQYVGVENNRPVNGLLVLRRAAMK